MNHKEQFEYTMLHANVNNEDIIDFCKKAMEKEVYAVCIPPYHIANAKNALKDSGVKVVTVCGFPFGNSHTAAKVEDVKKSLTMGADEIDLVVNFSAVKSQDWKTVENDISSVTTLCHMQDKICKVIIEIGLLTDEEKKQLLVICEKCEVDYVKTSTGMYGKSTSTKDIQFLKDNCKLKIKASGGIKTKSMATRLINSGADRIGASTLII